MCPVEDFEAINIEQKVLGAILTDPEYALPIAESILEPDDFYLEGHRIVYRIACDLRRQGIAPDMMSVLQVLRSTNQSKQLTDSSYIMALGTSVVSALSVDSHARIVLDASRRRSVIKSCHRAVLHSLDANRPLDQILQSLGGDLDAVSARGVSDNSLTTLQDIAAREADRLSAMYNAGNVRNGLVTTGFSWLDDALGGYQAGDLIIWSARPNTGKTRILLYSLAASAAMGNRVAFISLDMAKQRLLQYLIPTAVNVRGGNASGHDLYNPHMWGAVEEAKLRDFCAQADPDGNFWMVAEPSSTSLSMIEAYCYKLSQIGVKVVAVDQAQNIQGWDGGASNRGEYARIFQGLKQMARAYGMAVVLVHQIQRAGAGAPTLANLKDTGNAEEYSDAVVILHDTQRALIDSFGSFVLTAHGVRKPKQNEADELLHRNVDIVRPIRMDLAKNRNAETMRQYVNFDFARGIKGA